MLRYSWIFAVSIAISNHALADTQDGQRIDRDLARCAAIDRDLERLTCFDRIARSRGVDSPKVRSIPGKGKWQITAKTSPIDDSTNVYLTVEANSDIRGWLKTYRPVLNVRCKEGKVRVYVVTAMIAAGDETDVTLRFDKMKAYREQWSNSTDHEAVFLPRLSGTDFVNKMTKHRKLLFQITPFNASPTMTTFDLAGLSDAVKPLREACKWEEGPEPAFEQIRRLQSALRLGGYYDGALDGILGGKTLFAVEQFQIDNSLTPTGYPNREVLKRLNLMD